MTARKDFNSAGSDALARPQALPGQEARHACNNSTNSDPPGHQHRLLWIVGVLTAPIFTALTCRSRSRRKHQQRTFPCPSPPSFGRASTRFPASPDMFKHKHADFRGQIAMQPVPINLGNQFRERAISPARYFLQLFPKGFFETNARLMPANNNGTLFDR